MIQLIVALQVPHINSAGIPDFRGKGGIYSTGLYYPYKTFDYDYFKKDPSHFFKFAKDFIGFYDRIMPTQGHKFLAELEQKGKLKAVITQNIDGLHQMAGSKHVIEVHGGFQRLTVLMQEIL
jgi:NAD-dependent deacetylase